MKVAALVSGGVDSSVALALLKKQGHDVTAFYLKIWLEDDISHLGECPWEEDLNFVKKVCKQLDVPLKIINLQKEYWKHVVQYALNEVKQGRTPNPDIFCNARIKFSAFLEKIEGFEKIATGHYADIEQKNKLFYLKRVRDQIKDQTYFLAHLSQVQLSKIIFPLAPYTKHEVRELAQQFNLPNKNRKDSQGICFLGKIKYPDFLKHYLGEKKGPLVNADTNETLGEHNGYWYYTIGQRKGFGLGGGPWYVVKKDPKKNAVYISNHYHEKTRNNFEVKEFHWIVKPDFSKPLKVKLRHGKELYNCTIKGKKIMIEGSDQGIAAGQFAVFYDELYCYGCGVIV